jgi:acetyl-CoA acetyltransferase family protein
MQKAVTAEANGWFKDHIVPFKYTWDGEEKVVEKDETLRPKAVEDPEGYMEDLSKLRPSFKEDGMVTPGNSSQIVDGAAAALLMTADKAEELGLDPLCRIIGSASVGSAPMPMLLGPIPASKKALARAGKTMDDMDVIVANEAFASPCLVWAKELGYDVYEDRFNPFGGAISLGHPIGASGLIYFGEMIHHLKRINGKYGIKTLCGGGGVGITTVVEAL